MYGKGKVCKVKESICNIPIEAANICNILPRPAVSKGLIVVKLKRYHNTRVMYISNQFVHTYTKIFFRSTSLKSHNKFYEDISVTKGLYYITFYYIHGYVLNETTLVFEIPNIILSKMLSFHQSKKKQKF